jgi:hypothetical protein
LQTPARTIVTPTLADILHLVVFIDETKDVARDVEDEGLEDADYDDGDAMADSPSPASEAQPWQPQPAQTAGRADAAGYSLAPPSPTDRFIVHEDVSAQRRSGIYLPEAIWPLTDREEALLFRHYVQKLATWVSVFAPRVGTWIQPCR